MRLEYFQLTAWEAKRLWEAFGKVIGEDRLKKIYGSYWPREKLPEESVWRVMDAHNFAACVGWCSLRQDPIDPVVWFALGIFPEFQNQRLSTPIFQWAIEKTKELWPEALVMAFVVNKNYPYCDVQERSKSKVKMGELNWPFEQYGVFGVNLHDIR